MEKTYFLNDCELLVVFEDKLIRIKKPEALQQFLSRDIELRSTTLVNHIKLDYLDFTGNALGITNDSMIVEIWGHVYASYVAKAIKKLIRLKLVGRIADFIIHRGDTIDCGENDVDSNRKFWDLFANFKGMIQSLLPKKIKSSI